MDTNSRGGIAATVRSPLDVAEATFRLLACEPGGLALPCTGLAPQLPQRQIGLVELRDLLCSRSVGNAARDEVWRQLVTLARQGDPSWVVSAVGMALPALRGIAGSLRRGSVAGDPYDLDTEVLTGFLEALRTLEVDRPNIRPRLCDAARRAGERARRIAEADACRRIPSNASCPPKAPWGHPDLVLADAVTKGVISEVDAELIGRTRLEDLTLAEAAGQLGLTAEAAKKRRQRAEPVLCAAVQSGEVQAGLSLPITSSAPRRVEAHTSARSRDTSDTRSASIEPKGGRGAIPGSARNPLPLPAIARTRLYPCGLTRCRRTASRTICGSAPMRLAVVAVVVLVLLAAWAVAGHADTLAAPKKPESLQQVIENLRNWLVGFLVALATLMATVGGLRYLLAGGDPGEVAKAKNTLRFAAFGYAIAALAPVLVSALKSIVGV